MGCVTHVELQQIEGGNYASVCFTVTVVRSYKGKLNPNERAMVFFDTELDSRQPEKAKAHIERLQKTTQGQLRFFFLEDAKSQKLGGYSTEWLYVPKYTKEIEMFLEGIRIESPKRASK